MNVRFAQILDIVYEKQPKLRVKLAETFLRFHGKIYDELPSTIDLVEGNYVQLLRLRLQKDRLGAPKQRVELKELIIDALDFSSPKSLKVIATRYFDITKQWLERSSVLSFIVLSGNMPVLRWYLRTYQLQPKAYRDLGNLFGLAAQSGNIRMFKWVRNSFQIDEKRGYYEYILEHATHEKITNFVTRNHNFG